MFYSEGTSHSTPNFAITSMVRRTDTGSIHDMLNGGFIKKSFERRFIGEPLFWIFEKLGVNVISITIPRIFAPSMWFKRKET